MQKSTIPFLSIIVPTCNRNIQLGYCLDRLKPGTQSIITSLYEVIVTDDSKNDHAETFLREKYPWAIYAKGPKKGPAANRNNGAKMAKGQWLVFTDDDCLPDPGWLEGYISAIKKDPECMAFEGAILPDDWQLLKKDMAECPVNEIGGLFWSANISINYTLFNKVGGFTELFPIAANEDQELALKLKKYTKIVFCGDSIVVHPVRFVTLIDKIKKIPTSVRSQVFYRALHGYSGIPNYFDGLRIHILSAISESKKFHFKRVIYNLVGLTYRLFAGGFIIYRTKQQINKEGLY